MFGGNFAPRNWSFCDGQLLAINTHSALFSILGTTFGGDGRTTFGLPDLRGRVPMHPGNGPGLTPRRLGEKTGTETNTLLTANLPPHNHNVSVKIASGLGNTNLPGGNPLGATARDKETSAALEVYRDDQTFGTEVLGGVVCANTGSSTPVNNIQPVQCVNFIICLVGLFPSRN